MYSVLKHTERIIDRIVDIIFVLILVVGVYYIYDSVFVYTSSTAAKATVYKPQDGNPEILKELSEDCVAWVTIYDSGVDYPVMQGKNNTEYLNKDPYGSYSLSGSIFLDSRCAGDFTDDYSLVYGHHMSGNYMFGVLDAFVEEAYFDTHRKGELTAFGKYYELETIAFVHTDASEGLIFNPQIEGDRMQWVRQNAAILREPSRSGGRLVALSTCKSPTSTLRTIVFVMIYEQEGEP